MEKISLLTACLALLVLSCRRISADECNTDFIRLSFKDVTKDKPSSEAVVPESGPCGVDEDEIHCYNTDYPGDIVCDVGALRNLTAWQGVKGTTEIAIKYDHPTVKGTLCTLKFSPEVDGRENFAFRGAECSTPVPEETVPHFRLSNILLLEIFQYSETQTFLGKPCGKKMFVFGVHDRDEVVNANDLGMRVYFYLTNFDCEKPINPLGENVFAGVRVHKTFLAYTQQLILWRGLVADAVRSIRKSFFPLFTVSVLKNPPM